MTEFGVIARPITSTQTDASLTRDNRDKDEMLAYLEARVDALKAEVRRLREENTELMTQLIDTRAVDAI